MPDHALITADDFSKTESFEISPSQLVNDGSNYAVVFNFVADDFFYDQVFDFRFKNIRLYKSTGDVIDDIMIQYSYITGGSLTNLQSLNSLKLTTMPQKCSLNVTHLKEGKAAIIFVINDSGFSSINRVAFDIEINMTEKVERNASNVDYEYKITLKLDETIAIMPGKNTSKNVETMEFYGESYDIVDAPNYVVEARVSINNIRKYIEDYGRYAIPTMEVNPDFYGNVLVWIQTMLLLYVAEGTVFGEIGYLPIPIEDVTLPIDDSLTLTFLRNDWATNIGTMIMLANSVSIEELTYLASQYLTPIPADMDESINIPFQIGSLKNIPVEIFMTMYEVIESVIGTGQVDYDIPIMELGLLFEISMQAEMFRQSPEGPESFGLSKNFRLAEFITMQQSGMLDDADPGISMEQLQTITVDYIFFVPGTTFNDFGGYRITECYYESVDVVVYNADSTALDLYALPTKAYKTDNSNLFVDDGVLYTKDKTLAKYPSLKPGGMYEVLDGTKTIEANAFSGSKNLSRVTVPKSVETIDKNAFRNSSVSILYVNREMVNNYTMELVDILNASNVATLYVMLDGYVSDVRLSKLSQKAYCRVELLVVDNQSGLAFALGDGGAYVSGLSNRNVEYVVIPSTVEIGGEQENVTRIGQNAFKNCLNLKTIEIPSTITTIGDDAFMNCPKLTELYFDAAKIQEIGTGNLRKGMSVYTTDRSTANIVYSSMENAYCVEWGFYTNEDNFIAEFDYTLTIGSRSFKYNGHYNKIEADNTAFRQFVIISMETDEEQLITFHEKASTPLNDNNDILGSFTRITKTPKGSNTGIEFIGRNEYIEYEGNSVDNFYPETGLGVSTQTDCWIYINLGLYITEVS